MHIVPFIKNSLNHHIVVSADNAQNPAATMQLSARTVFRQTISPAQCHNIFQDPQATAQHFCLVFENLKFTPDPTAQMLPAMYDDTFKMFAYTPWSYWPMIVQYYMRQNNSCIQVALLLEAMQVSERTQIGTLDFEVENEGFAVFADDTIQGAFQIVRAADSTVQHIDKSLCVFRTSTIPLLYTPCDSKVKTAPPSLL